MTRKDYIAIGTALAQALAEATSREKVDGIKSAMEHISHAFQIDNERFRPQQFESYVLDKAGLSGEEKSPLKNIKKFLKEREGKDLITVIHELKHKFSLTDKGAHYVLKELGYI